MMALLELLSPNRRTIRTPNERIMIKIHFKIHIEEPLFDAPSFGEISFGNVDPIKKYLVLGLHDIDIKYNKHLYIFILIIFF
jgi:hypothetical protein